MTEHRSPGDESSDDDSMQSFQIVVGPDGAIHSVGMTETFADGAIHLVSYENVPTDDEYVRIRQRIAGEDPPSEVSTTFEPSLVRPRTYPAGMPFLEGRESHTTESPRKSRSEGN